MVQHVSKLAFVAAAILVLMVCWAESKNNCKAQLQKSGLIPTFADSNTKGNVKVVFPGNNPMKCGSKIEFLKVQQEPTVTVDLTKECDMASIVMFDPDTPTPKTYLHWLVLDILTTVLKNTYAGKGSGKTYADFQPPGTVTGDHRYTICVYCQQGSIKTKKYPTPLQRQTFDPNELAQNKSLGSPKSCNFMYVVGDASLQPDSPFEKPPKIGGN